MANQEWRTVWWIPRILVAMAVIAMAACTNSDVVKPPVTIPISLSEAGVVVDQKVMISDHAAYWFSLNFLYKENDQLDRARVRKLLGGHETDKEGKPIEPGVPTPVWIGVYSIDGQREVERFSKEIDPVLTSWGADTFGKLIGSVLLEPGTYVVRLKLLRAVPEADGTPVSFGIGHDKFKTKFDPKK